MCYLGHAATRAVQLQPRAMDVVLTVTHWVWSVPGSKLMHYRRCLAASVIAFAVLAPAIGAEAPAEAPAETAPPAWSVWTPKQLRFVYSGFTSHYSCDGLRDKMRAILLQLGARADLTVQPVPCSGLAGRPTEFPGVTVNMNVPAPWDAPTANPAATPVPAHWQTVVISTELDPLREAGDCELIEQVKARVLPLFNARNVEYHSTCVPHQLQIGGTQLKADMLIVDDQRAKRSGGAPPSAAPPSAAPPPPAPPPASPPR
jgi:hypothetical protein